MSSSVATGGAHRNPWYIVQPSSASRASCSSVSTPSAITSRPSEREAALAHRGEELAGEARAGDVGGGDVDREPQVAERLGPGGRGGDRLALHMVRKLGEIVRALGHSEQGRSAQFAILRVPPARERLDPADRAARYRDLRLEADLDLVLVERTPEVDLEPVAARGGAFGACLDHMDRRALAPRFGERGAC